MTNDDNAVIAIIRVNKSDWSMKVDGINLDYGKKTRHNSFMFENKLFVFSIGKDGSGYEKDFIALDIYDHVTKIKYRQHKFGYDEKFALRASGIYKSGSTKRLQMERETTAAVFARMGKAI